jgi:DNA-binding NarL/FixJ family response regulator
MGISDIGASLYIHLIEAGPTPTPDLLERFGGGVAGAALERLREVGLVVGEPNAARHPDYALQPVVAKAEATVALLKVQADEMRDLFEARNWRGPNAAVELLTSRQRIAAAIDDLTLGAHREVLKFITWPFVPLTALHAPGDPARRNPDGTVRRPQRRYVYERAVLEDEQAMMGLRNVVALGADVRVAKSLPFKAIISDRETAMVPQWPRGYPDQMSTLLIRSGSLLESMIVTFEHYWNDAMPLDASHRGFAAEQTTPLDAIDMRILNYIVAGQTDAQMSRLLDLSKSTILRRIKKMREAAGVDSRPALIFHAARNNWMP